MRIPAILALVGLCSIGQPALAAIAYVDATTTNTILSGKNWHRHTAVGNGGNGVWTADESSSNEEVAPLLTTVTLPEAGVYQVYTFVWDSEKAGEDWEARLGLGSQGRLFRVLSSQIEPADPARFENTIKVVESRRRLMQVPLGFVGVSAGSSVQVRIADDASTGSNRAWYDGIGYEKICNKVGEQVIALDFNKTNATAAPSQAMFRVVNGPQTPGQNSTVIHRMVGPYGVRISKNNTVAFDSHGANGDPTRSIPGGPTSLSFLVADFLGSRDGTIRITVTNLAAGTYLFRSYHLEPLIASGFGYAQGANAFAANTIQARVGGALKAITQPTSLSSLGTTFIRDTDIPTLSFPFSADGENPVTIELSSVHANNATKYIFLNGFQIFTTIP